MTEKTELSKEDMALLIRSLWEALLAPAWKKDDLIELGKLIFAKVSLKHVDDDLFGRLLPNLTAAAAALGHLLLRPQATSPAVPTSQPASTEPPSSDPTKTEPSDG